MARHRFNPDDEFTVAAARLTIGRKTFRQGQRFDKSRVSRAKLRRLYERRSIVPATETETPRASRNRPAAKPAEGAPPIPGNWRELKWQKLLSLAASVSETRVVTKADAIAAIEQELARRA